MTDLYKIIRELVDERNKLDRIITSLEQMIESGEEGEFLPKRRGRRSMDAAAREQVSERMKRYWASKRGGSQQPRERTPLEEP